jgi:hypothetical protein
VGWRGSERTADNKPGPGIGRLTAPSGVGSGAAMAAAMANRDRGRVSRSGTRQHSDGRFARVFGRSLFRDIASIGESGGPLHKQRRFAKNCVSDRMFAARADCRLCHDRIVSGCSINATARTARHWPSGR